MYVEFNIIIPVSIKENPLIDHLNIICFVPKNPHLVEWKSIIADDEHVRIIPVPGTCELAESVLKSQIIIDLIFCPSLSSLIISVVVDDAEDRVPGVVNIIVIPSHTMAGYSNFYLFQVST